MPDGIKLNIAQIIIIGNRYGWKALSCYSSIAVCLFYLLFLNLLMQSLYFLFGIFAVFLYLFFIFVFCNY